MAVPRLPCCFSRVGEYFASCPTEGELKIWNTKTNSLHQTFSSSSLRGGVACLSWSRELGKKRGHSLSGGVGIKVILWDLIHEKESVLEAEHSDEVTCLDWDFNNARLFSGSKDRHVVSWNVDTREVIRKWKVDKGAVQCLSCYGDGSLLLTAGRTIKLWSLEDYTIIKKLAGHATAIGGLCFISEESFLSCAANDRVVNLWQPRESKVAVCSLICDEEVKAIDCCCVEGAEARVAVVGQDGGLFLYQFPLSSLPSSPLSPTFTIQYVSSPPKPATPSPLPVLAAVLSSESPDMITLAYSSCIRPALESMEFMQNSDKTCLIRDVNVGGLLLPASRGAAASSSQEKVTVLGPGNMAPHRDKQHDELRPLIERLESDRQKSKGAPPTADSLTQLLVQSITSGDGKLLEEVLRVSKERLIAATVKRLPLHVVLPFLKKLVELLQSSPYRGLQLSLWIKTILSSHPAYLLNVPELSASLGSLQQLLESRVATFSKLCELQGKLDLVLTQAESEDDGISAAQQALTTPLAIVTVGEESEEDVMEDWTSSEEESNSHSNDSGDETMET